MPKDKHMRVCKEFYDYVEQLKRETEAVEKRSASYPYLTRKLVDRLRQRKIIL